MAVIEDSFEAINRRNAQFWDAACLVRDARLSDSCLREIAFRALSTEVSKRASVRDQTTLESALESAAFAKILVLEHAGPQIEQRVRKNAAAEMGRKGGMKPRAIDPLGTIIAEAVARKPNVTLAALIQYLARGADLRDVIQDVTNDKVTFVNARGEVKDVRMAALAARLHRAKNRVKRR